MAEMNVKMCDVCQVPLSDNEKNRMTHFMGKKHKLAMHNANVSNVKEKCGVFMTGFPKHVPKENIVGFLNALGKCVETHIGENNSFVIVQFKDAGVADEVLRKPPTYLGKQILVKPRKVQNQNRPHEEVNTGLDLETLVAPLENIGDFYEQVATLMSNLQPESSEMFERYQRLCFDLENTLHPIFPGCKVYPFGSTVTGLDFAGSDIDAYVYVPYGPKEKPDEERAATLVKKSKKAFFRSNTFTNVVPIPKAKTPIVKCVHRLCQISCDVNFKNRLGVCNSHLIRYYLGLSGNLRATMVILKCWAKLHDFIGLNGKFSSYSLSMMFIFFLQQPPYEVPSTWTLQESPMYDDIVVGWNAGFNRMCNFANPRLNDASIVDLLHGFFSFYASFDYSVNVICPFAGRAILKTDFLNGKTLPPCFNRYKEHATQKGPLTVETPVCIQDPFELNHSVSRAVSVSTLEDFVLLCGHATRIMGRSETVCLYRLLMEEVEEVSQHRGTEKMCSFKVSMGSSLSYLERDIPEDSKDRVQSLQSHWFMVLNNFVIAVLIRIFKIDVTLIKDEEPSNKSLKLEGQTDVHDQEPVDIVRFSCEGTHNLWEARRSLNKGLVYPDEVTTPFDREVYLSNYICSLLQAQLVKPQAILSFNITLVARTAPTCTEVVLTNEAGNGKQFKTFGQFFMSKLPYWFELHEKELNKSAKETADAVKV